MNEHEELVGKKAAEYVDHWSRTGLTLLALEETVAAQKEEGLEIGSNDFFSNEETSRSAWNAEERG